MAHQGEARIKEGGGTIRTIHKWLSRLSLLEDTLLVMLLAGMILIAAAQILLRNFFDMGLAWGDQALRVMVLWLGLTGAIAASRDNKHINIAILSRFLPESAQFVSRVVVAFFAVMVCAVIAVHAGRFVYLEYQMGTTTFANLPAWIIELILPVGFSLIALRYLGSIVDEFEFFHTKEGGR